MQSPVSLRLFCSCLFWSVVCAVTWCSYCCIYLVMNDSLLFSLVDCIVLYSILFSAMLCYAMLFYCIGTVLVVCWMLNVYGVSTTPRSYACACGRIQIPPSEATNKNILTFVSEQFCFHWLYSSNWSQFDQPNAYFVSSYWTYSITHIRVSKLILHNALFDILWPYFSHRLNNQDKVDVKYR